MVRVVPRSVRTRLVLLFSVGTALVLLVCLLVLHEALDRQLDGALANDLSGRYDDLSAAVGAATCGRSPTTRWPSSTRRTARWSPGRAASATGGC
jgi:hypothetical protein